MDKCPFCLIGELYTKPAALFPFLKEKVDIYCKKCGFIFTGTIVKEDETLEKIK